MTQQQVEKLNDLCAKAGEVFHDYLIVVRPDHRGIAWKSSDPTWALGAAVRYAQGVKMGDTLDQAEDFRHGNGG